MTDADLLLALDQSRSMCQYWRLVLEYAESFAGAFCISSNRTHVAVIKFGTEAEVVFNFDKYSDCTPLQKAIGNIYSEGGSTNIVDALRRSRKIFTASNGARNGVPKILVMITDGRASVKAKKTVKEAKKTTAAGIIIFTVGVGFGVNKDELEKIASKPEYFFANDSVDLSSIVEKLRVATTTSTTTTTAMPVKKTSITTTSRSLNDFAVLDV